MSNRKNYNSIVFLTTLSLYLGLVLAGGATPTVLAQAATTRNFDIKSEVVIEDDLDKKPDDEEIEEFLKLDLSEPILSFLEDLRKLASIEKYDLVSEIHVEGEYKNEYSNASYFTGRNRWHAVAALGAVEKIYDSTKYWSDFIDEAEPEDRGVRQKISLTVNANGLELETAFRKDSPKLAGQMAANLTKVFKVKLDESKSALDKQIYENTKATTENNQVFIVTRLPRASIDDLLAKK